MSDTGRAVLRFFGVMMMAVGALMAALSGACTLLFAGGSLLGGDRGSLIPMALLIGGPSVAIGLGLWFGGRALYRKV